VFQRKIASRELPECFKRASRKLEKTFKILKKIHKNFKRTPKTT